ncbi:hypothetical protein CVT24_009349 [Panaeolus cyanescens]|uniref:Uncharacterized protein n=1 Tax=Panaeolus cyanescens TaxID=181874 RepID=A0A409Y860_9AGAR|nr:hypothetical protein CVT24_009349 [Panaeolus cyanescens]
MKSVLVSLASAALLAGSAVAQNAPLVNTPASSTVCQPLLITWSGGTPPYFLRSVILPGGQPSAAPLIDFGQVEGTQLSWTVNVTNSELGINLRDSTGLLSQSAAFPNLPGTNQACLNAPPPPPPGSTTGGPSSSSSVSTPANPPTTPSAPATTAAPPPPPTTRSTTTPVTSATTPTTPVPTPSDSTGASSSLSVNAGLAGAIGLIIASLFA